MNKCWGLTFLLLTYLLFPTSATGSDTWSDDMEAGKQAYYEGRYEDAIRHLRLATEKADRSGGRPEQLIQALDYLGGVYFQLGRMEQAAKTYRQAIQAAKSRLGSDHPEVQMFQRKLVRANELWSPGSSIPQVPKSFAEVETPNAEAENDPISHPTLPGDGATFPADPSREIIRKYFSSPDLPPTPQSAEQRGIPGPVSRSYSVPDNSALAPDFDAQIPARIIDGDSVLLYDGELRSLKEVFILDTGKHENLRIARVNSTRIGITGRYYHFPPGDYEVEIDAFGGSIDRQTGWATMEGATLTMSFAAAAGKAGKLESNVRGRQIEAWLRSVTAKMVGEKIFVF